MKAIHIAVLTGLALLGSTPAAHAQAGDPCALLSLGEVQQAFPGSKPGRVDRPMKEQGLLRCEWQRPNGVLVLISGGDETADSPREDAESWMLGFLDPLRHDSAQRHVRFETLPGVGDEAVAVVEREDPAKGITRDCAVLVVRRGKRQVSLLADRIRPERAEALKVLADLGKTIAKRLE